MVDLSHRLCVQPNISRLHPYRLLPCLYERCDVCRVEGVRQHPLGLQAHLSHPPLGAAGLQSGATWRYIAGFLWWCCRRPTDQEHPQRRATTLRTSAAVVCVMLLLLYASGVKIAVTSHRRLGCAPAQRGAPTLRGYGGVGGTGVGRGMERGLA